MEAVGRGQDGTCLEQGYALLMKRAEPLEPDDREGFLHRVPSHRALIDAYRERSGVLTAASA